jgi:hypothetical protein
MMQGTAGGISVWRQSGIIAPLQHNWQKTATADRQRQYRNVKQQKPAYACIRMED